MHDISASFVVFLIALPLSMGIALASGVPPALGLVTAIIGGIVVGVLGGAPLQISGPSAGLTVLVLQMHEVHGMQKMPAIVLVAGAVQLTAGLLRVGRQFQAVSPAVVRGMLTGIGVLIIAGQFHLMIDDHIHESGLRNLLQIPAGIVKAIRDYDDAQHDLAALIGIATLATVFGWEWLRERVPHTRPLPGPLVGATLGAGLAWGLGWKIRYVAVPERLLDVLTPASMKTMGHLLDGDVLLAGGALAFVASAETLLCATAVSRMHDHGRTNYDRELAAQGLANILCGCAGALPVTGVISRSTANVEAGARSRYSAVLQAVWIALFVMLLPKVLALVPRASLAAILIYIGFKLLNYRAVQGLSRFGRGVMAVFAVTALGVVLVDLLTGIMVGLALSAARLLYIMSHARFDVIRGAGDRVELHLHGSATFLCLPQLADILDQVPAGSQLHFHFDELEFIDHACLDYLGAFRDQHERGGGQVVVEWDELFELRHKLAPVPTADQIAGPRSDKETGGRPVTRR